MDINFKREKKNQHETTESQGRIGFAKVYEKWTWEAIESKILTVHRKEPCFANEKKKNKKTKNINKSIYGSNCRRFSSVFSFAKIMPDL